MRKLFKGRSTERDAFRIPRSVQQSIPIKRIYKDGIFRVSGRFSKTWRFLTSITPWPRRKSSWSCFWATAAFSTACPSTQVSS